MTTNSSNWIVGIDLGTTHSAMASLDPGEARPEPRVFPIRQWTAPDVHEERSMLPSCLYATGSDTACLPWEETTPAYMAGYHAREQGALQPGRLVASAKSWLCHTGVDRHARLLPWHADPDVAQLSPVEATTRLLQHMKDCWDQAHPDHPLAEQHVIITIPASFDDSARTLTIEAAQKIGLSDINLVEEPLTAFYTWLQQREETAALPPGQTILVCDIGGGTTDFSIIKTREAASGQASYQRTAVGEHLILGGDNLDLTLAHHVEDQLDDPLPPQQWLSLVRTCRYAKECLLANDAPQRYVVHIAGGGSKLIGGGQQVELQRDEVRHLLLDGFLPEVALSDRPAPRAGFREFGLPYAEDPAITRYLAAFLSDNGENAAPDAVLFNGGLFAAPCMCERLMHVLRSWYPNREIQRLNNPDIHLAVAGGAALYGYARQQKQLPVDSHLSHSYYIGIQQNGQSARLCLAPAGTAEGAVLPLPDHPFKLRIGAPVQFPLYSTAHRHDAAGTLVKDDRNAFHALPPLQGVLKAGKKARKAEVDVTLETRLTENGLLEVWAMEAQGPRRWQLAFDTRGHTARIIEEPVESPSPPLPEQAITELFKVVFNLRKTPPEALVKRLEALLEQPRQEWSPGVLRTLWEHLLPHEPARAHGPQYEARWFNLLGYTLRPGCGHPLDEWRVEQTWKIVHGGIRHKRNEQCRAEWWILWRRIAGGLSAGQQQSLAAPMLSELKTTKKKGPPDFRCGSHEKAEQWRLLGALEQLPQDTRIQLGNTLCEHLGRTGSNAFNHAASWTLGRLGSRIPLNAPLNAVLPAQQVEKWLSKLTAITSWHPVDLANITLMARRCDDRFRDISPAARKRCLEWMASQHAPDSTQHLIREGGQLDQKEQATFLGDRLPHGLQLLV